MTILPRRFCYAPIFTAASLILAKPALSFAFRSQASLVRSSRSTRLMSAATDDAPKKKPVVQYIVLRRDLDWPAGAMAAQAAHASLAAVAQALEQQHAPTQEYISPANLPHMTKYVYGVDTLEELEAVRDKWNQSFPGEGDNAPPTFHWWVEQPENIPTAFATWPIERTNKVSKVVKNMKLSFF